MHAERAAAFRKPRPIEMAQTANILRRIIPFPKFPMPSHSRALVESMTPARNMRF